MKNLLKTKKSGFTIVELLIVIVVIAILAAITIVAYNGIRQRAQESGAKTALANATKKIETYRFDPTNPTQEYPATLAVAGVPTDSGSTLTYNYFNSGNYYCLESKTGTAVYYQTSLSAVQKPGFCPATSGLIAWWPMNGDAKNYVNGTNGTVSNATLGQGQNGTANGSYVFAGTSTSNIDTNHTASRNAFSFSIWAYPTVLSGYQTPLSETRDCCVSGLRGIELKASYSVAGAASLALWAGGGGSAASVTGTSSTLNAWNFYVGTYNGTTLSFYKDGALIGSSAYAGVPGTPTQDLYIGTTPTGNGPFIGRVDDVRIYDRALTAQEITTLYSVGAE